LLAKRCEKRFGASVVSEGFADVGKAIHIAGPENKTSPKLKRIFAEFVLMMARGPRSFAGGGVVAAEQMQEIGGAESGGAIGAAVFVNQQGKCDAGFFAKPARVMTIAQTDGCQGSSFAAESLLVFAQLRDVLAAENSFVMAQENDHSGRSGPQRAEPHVAAIGIRKHDHGQSATE
jgi:hypothetical protein